MTRIYNKHNGFKLAAFFAFAVLLNGYAAKATTVKTERDIEIISADTLSRVTFLGNSGDGLLFNVALKNTEATKFTLIITNESGVPLFSKVYSDVNFDKNFKLVKTEDKGNYYFRIQSDNSILNQTFFVKASSRQVADIAITKL